MMLIRTRAAFLLPLLVPVQSASSRGPHPPAVPTSCFASVADQADPSTCLQASSTPTLGLLYPLSNELFVDSTSGDVGVGTSSPAFPLTLQTASNVFGFVHTDGVHTLATYLGLTSGEDGCWLGSRSNH